MTDSICRDAQHRVDRITAAAIAAATKAYGKVLPSDVQDIVVASFSMLLPDIEAEHREEERLYQLELAARNPDSVGGQALADAYANRVAAFSASVSAEKAGGTSSD